MFLSPGEEGFKIVPLFAGLVSLLFGFTDAVGQVLA